MRLLCMQAFRFEFRALGSGRRRSGDSMIQQGMRSFSC